MGRKNGYDGIGVSKTSLFFKKIVAIKNMLWKYIWALINGLLAQLAEQLTLNQWVWGSNPQESTIYVYKSMSRLYFFEKNIAYTTCVWYYQ